MLPIWACSCVNQVAFLYKAIYWYEKRLFALELLEGNIGQSIVLNLSDQRPGTGRSQSIITNNLQQPNTTKCALLLIQDVSPACMAYGSSLESLNDTPALDITVEWMEKLIEIPPKLRHNRCTIYAHQRSTWCDRPTNTGNIHQINLGWHMAAVHMMMCGFGKLNTYRLSPINNDVTDLTDSQNQVNKDEHDVIDWLGVCSIFIWRV